MLIVTVRVLCWDGFMRPDFATTTFQNAIPSGHYYLCSLSTCVPSLISILRDSRDLPGVDLDSLSSNLLLLDSRNT